MVVHLDRSCYSVPASFANRPVSLRVYPERIVIAAEGQILCEHPRIIDRSHDGRGRPFMTGAIISRSCSASLEPYGTERRSLSYQRPSNACSSASGVLRVAIGEMVEVLALVLHHDEQAVLTAVELALEDGVPSKTHILNHLHRLTDGKAAVPPAVRAPQALVLTREPIADVGRYNSLRQDGVNRHAS